MVLSFYLSAAGWTEGQDRIFDFGVTQTLGSHGLPPVDELGLLYLCSDRKSFEVLSKTVPVHQIEDVMVPNAASMNDILTSLMPDAVIEIASELGGANTDAYIG
jgi:hypothetical protein